VNRRRKQPSPNTRKYVVYVDDSGDHEYSLHTGLLFPQEWWTEYLRRWLQFRRTIYQQHGVPSRYELHSYEWVMGKGKPVGGNPEAPVNRSVSLRREIAENALKTINSMLDLRVVTCRYPGPIKSEAYARFIQEISVQLIESDAHAVIVMDGDPINPDPHVRRAHRDLPVESRRVLEDGWIQNSAASQFIQMADLAAYSAHQAVVKNNARKFMWDWYETYLHPREWSCTCGNP